jgi:hypothetical protein
LDISCRHELIITVVRAGWVSSWSVTELFSLNTLVSNTIHSTLDWFQWIRASSRDKIAALRVRDHTFISVRAFVRISDVTSTPDGGEVLRSTILSASGVSAFRDEEGGNVDTIPWWLEWDSVSTIWIVSDSSGEGVTSDNIKIITDDTGIEWGTSTGDSVTELIFAGENETAGIADKNSSIIEVSSDGWVDMRAISRNQDQWSWEVGRLNVGSIGCLVINCEVENRVWVLSCNVDCQSQGPSTIGEVVDGAVVSNATNGHSNGVWCSRSNDVGIVIIGLEEEGEWNTDLKDPWLITESFSAWNVDGRLRNRHRARNNLEDLLVVNGKGIAIGIIDEDLDGVVSGCQGSAGRESGRVDHLATGNISGILWVCNRCSHSVDGEAWTNKSVVGWAVAGIRTRNRSGEVDIWLVTVSFGIVEVDGIEDLIIGGDAGCEDVWSDSSSVWLEDRHDSEVKSTIEHRDSLSAIRSIAQWNTEVHWWVWRNNLDGKRVIWQLDWVLVDDDDIARVNSGSEVGKGPFIEELVTISVKELEDDVEDCLIIDNGRCRDNNSLANVRDIWINVHVDWLTNCDTINVDGEDFEGGRNVGGGIDGVNVLSTSRVPAEDPVGLVVCGDTNLGSIEIFVVSFVVDGHEGDNEWNFSTSSHVDVRALVADQVGGNIDLGVLRNHWTVTSIRRSTRDDQVKGDVGNVEESVGDDVELLVEKLDVIVAGRDEPRNVILEICWDTQGQITTDNSGIENDLSHVVSRPDSEEVLLIGVREESVHVLIVDVNINSDLVASSLHGVRSGFLPLAVTRVGQELGVGDQRCVRKDVEDTVIGAHESCLSWWDEELVFSSLGEGDVAVDSSSVVWIWRSLEEEWVRGFISSFVKGVGDWEGNSGTRVVGGEEIAILILGEDINFDHVSSGGAVNFNGSVRSGSANDSRLNIEEFVVFTISEHPRDETVLTSNCGLNVVVDDTSIVSESSIFDWASIRSEESDIDIFWLSVGGVLELITRSNLNHERCVSTT